MGRHCPQALGQTVVITSKQASGAKQAGRGRVGVRRRLSGFDILINTARPIGHALLGTPSSHAAATPASQHVSSIIATAEYLMTGYYFFTRMTTSHDYDTAGKWQPHAHLFTTTVDTRYHSLNAATAADTAASHEVHERA